MQVLTLSKTGTGIPAIASRHHRGVAKERSTTGTEASKTDLYALLEKNYQFRRNAVSNRIEYCHVGESTWRVAEDTDFNTMKIRAKREWKLRGTSVSEITEWANSLHTTKYHPIQDFLNGLTWDGLEHIGTLASLVQTENDELFAAYLRAWLVRACDQVFTSRANEYMLVLSGEQGIGKTTFARALLPRALQADYCHTTKLEQNKDSLALLTTKWLIIDDELAALRKADVENIKAILSTESVTYRPPYGRSVITRPRIASFVGSTNDAEFLKDPTGSRRFLAINARFFDLPALRVLDSTQVWAEAMALYRAGERGFLTDDVKSMQSKLNAAKDEQTLSDQLVASYVRASQQKSDWKNTTDIAFALAQQIAITYPDVRTPFTTQASIRELAKALRKAGMRQDTNGVKRWCVRVVPPENDQS